MDFKDKIMLYGFRKVTVGDRLVRWEGWKGNEVVNWKVERVVRWEGGRFLVLLKGEEHRVSPRFYLSASDVNQGNEGDGLKIFLRARRDGKTLLRSSSSC